LASNIDVIFEQ